MSLWRCTLLQAWVLMPDHMHLLLQLGEMIRDGINREAAARYIVANPVRAGLVRSCRDYPYWNAIWLV